MITVKNQWNTNPSLILFSQYSYEPVSQATQTIDQVQGSFRNSILSENIHNQGSS